MEKVAFPIHLSSIPKPSASFSLLPQFSFLPPTCSLTINAVTIPQFSKHSAVKFRAKEHKGTLGAIYVSDMDTPSTDTTERWLLQPVGDGDTRHIGFNVEMPGAIEIVSSEVIVGRLPEKADVVIPVATVSGVHARIKKKEGNLLVTDLDSTNGTFIDDKRLRPGVITQASSGSCITFGDTHLAMFRISKIENVEEKSDEEQETTDTQQ